MQRYWITTTRPPTGPHRGTNMRPYRNQRGADAVPRAGQHDDCSNGHRDAAPVPSRSSHAGRWGCAGRVQGRGGGFMSTRGKGRLTRHTPSGSTGDDEMGLAAADAVFRTYQDFFFSVQYRLLCAGTTFAGGIATRCGALPTWRPRLRHEHRVSRGGRSRHK